MQSKEAKAKINAGRILVVGTQGGGKTAIVTKLSRRTDSQMEEYREDFGGTIETEYLKVSFDEGNFYSLLLPIGGQEKWAKLRTRFGSTAEAIVCILDSCTKEFWKNSIQQAISISTVVPYHNYPIAFIVTKRDLNEVITEEADTIGEVINTGVEKAKREGVKYYSRGFRLSERSFQVDSSDIPFTEFEQIIVNALEEKYFSGLVPGDARRGKILLPGFSLVNCRIFSRALTLGLSDPTGDPMAILGLLNDMRPTLLELDSSWGDLIRKYPKAGPEPTISSEISVDEIKKVINGKLLARDSDIASFEQEISNISELTGWNNVGWEHISIFDEKGLDKASNRIRKIMEAIKESQHEEKFTLFDPIEELF